MGRLRCLAFVLLVCSGMVCHTAGANTLEDAKQLIRAKRFDDAVHVLEILHDASQGTGESHYLLGSLYWLQRHGREEIARPLSQFEKAAELQYAKAMHRLGVLYLVGVEVPQDIARARELLSTANQLGYRLADTQLLHAQSDFFDMEEWDACALIDYQRDGVLLPTDQWSDRTKQRAFFCAVAAGKLRALQIWQSEEWGLQWRNRWGQTGLHVAVGAKTYSTLEWLLQNGMDADVADDRGNTPLHLAMALEDRASIGLLLQHKADWSIPNDAGRVPLEMVGGNETRDYALSRGARSTKKPTRQPNNPMVLKSSEPTDSGIFAGWPPIHVAAWLGKEKVVEKLVAAANLMSTDPEGYTPVMRAACAGNYSIYRILQKALNDQTTHARQSVELLRCFAEHKWALEFEQTARGFDTRSIDDDEFNALLYLAVEARFFDELGALLANETGNRRVNGTTLKRVAQKNNEALTRQLFEFAVPEIQQRVLFDALKYGWDMPSDLLHMSALDNWIDTELDTPLIAASSAGKVDVIRLLAPISEVNAQNKSGNTALHSAVLASNASAVEALLQAACDIEIRNEESLTPLMLAIDTADKGVVDLLVNAGANRNRRDKFGVSVIERIEASGRADLKHLLRR